MEKNFDKWNDLKKRLDNLYKLPFFNEREIWWCSIGINVGTEIYGKGKTFTRPVLVLKKFSKENFLGIPLTTKTKVNNSYYKFLFEGKEICAVLQDIKKIDTRRLGKKMGKMSELKFENLVKEVCGMIFDPQKGGRRTLR